MDAQARYHVAPGQFAVEMDGDLVMMGIEQGEYFGLSQVSRTIWERLVDGATLSELVETVTQSYEVDDETARADIETFCDDLISKSLIVAG